MNAFASCLILAGASETGFIFPSFIVLDGVIEEGIFMAKGKWSVKYEN